MVATIGPGEVLAHSVAEGDIPGVIALAADDSGVIYADAFGERQIGSGVRMTLDTVCWIASMTKAVTTVAALQLVEQGRLALDEPLGAWLPELANVRVLEGFEDNGTPRLRAPRTQVTLRHLLTHTAGFSYDIWNADIGRYSQHAALPGIIECKNGALTTPLVADPGERWEYGINIDWAGKAVEAVSGQSIEAYFRVNIFDPLGMRDTGFVIGPDQRGRLSSMHVRNADGSLEAIEFEVPQAPEFFMGGGGLYSTGPDYMLFLQALLHDGTFNGVQLLRPETVAEMRRNQIGELEAGVMRTAMPASSNDHDPYPGMPIRWGLGFMITTEPTGCGRAAGSLAWAGLANTYYWIDPVQKVTGVILTQILPFVDPKVIEVYREFERAVYAIKR
ncbi:MAG: beta-lactamase family protein [Chloroflexi bacterium]|nr:beta-lactamase family protein [Chloroflexota bacterium]